MRPHRCLHVLLNPPFVRPMRQVTTSLWWHVNKLRARARLRFTTRTLAATIAFWKPSWNVHLWTAADRSFLSRDRISRCVSRAVFWKDGSLIIVREITSPSHTDFPPKLLGNRATC